MHGQVLSENRRVKRVTPLCTKFLYAQVPSPKLRADAEKVARVAGKARVNGEDTWTRARAEERERRESAREEVAASWRMARKDIVDVWTCRRIRIEGIGPVFADQANLM